MLGKFLQKLGVAPAPAPKPAVAGGRVASQAQIQQALAQRRQTLGAMGVDPGERIAAAISAQVARQRIDREIRDCGGSPQLQDALRRLMADR